MSNKFTRTTPQKQLKLREKQTKSKQKVSTSVFQISISFTRVVREYQRNSKGRAEEKNCYLKFKKEREFLHILPRNSSV